MKNKLWVIAIITAILFCFIACEEEELKITTETLPNGTVGIAYSQKLTASDGSCNWWSVNNPDNFPYGLSLDKDKGVISGTPTRSGEYTFTISTQNSDHWANKELSITIDDFSGTYLDFAYTLKYVDFNDNYYFGNSKYYDKFCITITKYNGAGGSVTIPAQINEKPVMIIGDTAFSDCTSITLVTIPNSVKEIGYGAFSNCTSLTSVTIPNSIRYIRNSAFINCISLTSITIPDTYVEIEDYAFNSCTGLTNVRFEHSSYYLNDYFKTGTFVDSVNTASLKTAYSSGGIGTYTRPNTSSTTWTKQSE